MASVKKIVIFLITAVMITALAGCGGQILSETTAVQPSGERLSEFDPRCIDGYGNLTAYAFLELTGPEFTELLDAAGYIWDPRPSGEAFIRMIDAGRNEADSTYVQAASGLSDAEYLRPDGFLSADEPGGIAKNVVAFSLAGYGREDDLLKVRMDDAMAGVLNVETVRQLQMDEDSGVAVIKDSRGTQYLLMFVRRSGKAVQVVMVSERTIVDEGSTLAGYWQDISGEEYSF